MCGGSAVLEAGLPPIAHDHGKAFINHLRIFIGFPEVQWPFTVLSTWTVAGGSGELNMF